VNELCLKGQSSDDKGKGKSEIKDEVSEEEDL
jgi:hypothetical protein